MSTNKNKKLVSAIITIILMASIVLITTTSPATAQLAAQQPTPGPIPAGQTANITIETIPYLSFTPNPIGKGQPLLVNLWIQPPINVARQFINAFEVVITKPDGSSETIGPMGSYAGDATAWFDYVPEKAGEYSLQFNFLGMYYPAGRYLAGSVVANNSGTLMGSAYYAPSNTAKQSLVVQEEQVMSWPPSALPTDYWTRPISPEHREWWTILGNYPATGYIGGGSVWEEMYGPTNTFWNDRLRFIPWVQAPNTAHVVWKRQGDIGGLFGGQMGTVSLRPDPGYPAIIYAGRAYQTVTKVFNGLTQDVWQSYDIRTGEIFWEKTGMGNQVPTIITYTERTTQAVAGEEAMMRGLAGNLMYIGGGRMIKYDPWTGAVSANVSIAPLTSSTYYMHEFALGVQDLGAAAGANRYRLINWSTNDAGFVVGSGMSGGVQTNFTNRISTNISWPINNVPATTDFEAGVAVTTSSISPPSPSATGVTIGQRIVGISLKTGVEMWNVTVEDPGGHSQFFSGNTAVADQGKFAVRMISGEIKAWNLNDGSLAWTAPLPYPWGSFGPYHVASAYGLYFANSYDGVHGINWTNGNIEWTFDAKTPYQFETPYEGEYAFHVGIQVADGKVFTSAAEHTPSQPETRGLKIYALDALTGEQLWNFSASQLDESRTFTGAIADGYLAFASQYDSIMYVFGKGKTKTTVEAPLTAVTQGQGVIIKGTVLDQSPAQPNTPAVSKESMSAWMEYIHMQNEIPSDVKGVPVSIDAVDPNGQAIHIANATTDITGTYSYLWNPAIVGKYTITATFAGDDSYGSSFAGTAVGVIAASEVQEEQPQQTIQDYSLLFAALIAAIIVAIIIGVVNLILIKKKH